METDQKTYDYGEQPIHQIMNELNLSTKDLVKASSELITHKMVSKACKGRRLTTNVQKKILNALNTASNKEFKMIELFNYGSHLRKQ